MRQQFVLFQDGRINPVLSTQVLAIIEYAAKHPDKDSVFDVSTRDIRHLGGAAFFEALKNRGYNAIMALERGSYAGILGYQVHGTAWHCFAFRVQESHEHNGVGTGLARYFLEMWHASGGERVFLWGGNQRQKLLPKDDECMRRIYARAANNRFGLPFTLIAGKEPGELLLAGARSSVA